MIQDDAREKQLRQIFELLPGEGNDRIGVDACDEFGISYELKSTTGNSISAARGVNLDHFVKWRNEVWICGKGSENGNEFKFNEIYVLFPHELEPWFKFQEEKILADHQITVPFQKIAEEWDANLRKRAMLILDRGCRPAGALSFSWGKYVRKFGNKIENNHAQVLRELVEEKGKYLKGKMLYYVPQRTVLGGNRIKWLTKNNDEDK